MLRPLQLIVVLMCDGEVAVEEARKVDSYLIRPTTLGGSRHVHSRTRIVAFGICRGAAARNLFATLWQHRLASKG